MLRTWRSWLLVLGLVTGMGANALAQETKPQLEVPTATKPAAPEVTTTQPATLPPAATTRPAQAVPRPTPVAAPIVPPPGAGAHESPASPKATGAEAPAGAESTLDFTSMLFVFMLATFIGVGVIRRVSRLLHTPLMSLTNAISAIAVVGSIMVAGGLKDYPVWIRVLGAVALFCSMTNIISGFLITDRMLKMFKTREGAKS